MPQIIDVPGQGRVEFPDGMSDADIVSAIQKLAPPDQPVKPAPRATDALSAIGTGANQGMLRLLGLAGDTAYNVRDLGKAALGSAWLAAGKTPPKMLEVGDRSNDALSGDWLIKQARKTDAGKYMLNVQNPDYEGGYLQAVGGALASSPLGAKSFTQLANQSLLGGASAIASKLAYDKTGSPAAAVLAGFVPGLAQSTAVEGMKRAVRGGEDGRQAMVERIAALKAAGVDNPTLGLASGNQGIGGLENMLSSTPGAVNIMRNAREAAVEGMRRKTMNAADLASTDRGELAAGQGIQGGLKQFKEGFGAKQNSLYDALGNVMGSQFPTPVTNTKNALAALNADIPGAPALSGQFSNARLNSIERALLSDLGEIPSGSPVSIKSPILGRGPTPVGVGLDGRPIYMGPQRAVSVQPGATIVDKRAAPTRPDIMGRPVSIGSDREVTIDIPGQSVPVRGDVPMRLDSFGNLVPIQPVIGSRTTTIQPTNRSAFSGVGVADDPQTTLPFQAIKQTRSMVGSEIADSNLLSDIPRSKWNPLYGALTEDIRAGAANAGPKATAAFNRANDYSRAGYGRLERVAPIADKAAPEQSFAALEGTLRQNVSIFNAVKKSLPEGARGQVAGTIIEQLGTATPGQQNAAGNAWSPDTFLTNWNRMTPEGRKALLSGFKNADDVARDVDAVAKATAMMRDSSKMWANPSGTAANIAARGTIGSVGVGGLLATAGVLPWSVPAIAAGGLLGSNLTARALTSQKVRDAMANQTAILDPNQAAKDYLALTGGGLLGY